MPNAAPTRQQIKSLRFRLSVQTEELATCTTLAMASCVMGAIKDTERQLAEMGAA